MKSTEDGREDFLILGCGINQASGGVEGSVESSDAGDGDEEL